MVPLLVFIFVAVIAGGLFYQLSLQNEKIEDSNQQLSIQVKRIIKQVLFLRRQEFLFNKYGSRYEELTKQGLVKDLDRVKWVDGLLSIKNKLLFNELIIQFEPEIKLKRQDFKHFNLNQNIFYYTRLNIDFGMLIDSDIFKLKDDIDQNITPIYKFDKCDLKLDDKKIGGLGFNPLSSNINARCSLIVFQAKPRLLKKGSM